MNILKSFVIVISGLFLIANVPRATASDCGLIVGYTPKNFSARASNGRVISLYEKDNVVVAKAKAGHLFACWDEPEFKREPLINGPTIPPPAGTPLPSFRMPPTERKQGSD
jgi:hypothetical protein